MEKRIFIALALSLVFLSIWSKFVSKPLPPQNIVSQEIAKPEVKTPISTESITPINTTTLAQEETFDYSTNQKEITFKLPQAVIKDTYFQKYKYEFLIEDSLLLVSKTTSPLNFKVLKKDNEKIIFVYRDAFREIHKALYFDNSKHAIELRITIRNLTNSVQKESLGLVLSNRHLNPRSLEDNYLEIAIFAQGEQIKYIPAGKIKGSKFQDIILEGWAVSLRDHYGCAIIKSEGNNPIFIKKIAADQFLTGMNLEFAEILPNQTKEEKFTIYLGPQDSKEIAAIDPRLADVVNFGFFDPISKLLLGLLKFFYKITFNWGWAIIILTFFVFLILSPLSKKQTHSFKKMQDLAPEIEGLRKTYKDNPQKLNKEVMELYKRNHVNPFGGCLILVLQIPIFFALYQAFMRYIALKGANFLWIKDLAQEDRLFALPFSLPVIGNYFNILPIAMAIVMFLQQRLSLKSNAAANPEQQKMMLILFPILFGVMFYHMPAGLVLYWFVQSLLMFLYQWKISK